MGKLYYRGMAEENGKPKIGRSARLLGIRPGIDIDVAQRPSNWIDKQGYLRAETNLDPSAESVTVALRNGKGMSASLSIEGLPVFRRSAAFGGTGRDQLWQIDESKISGDLEAVQDSSTHVSILPKATMLLEKYETALVKTRDDWVKV
ncbi:MAG: hypothetical protein H7Z11_07950 [Verrucomicrobia bacterium]|nr:hypothetical protein [Leptolyngbya sp. ES-bin-22]